MKKLIITILLATSWLISVGQISGNTPVIVGQTVPYTYTGSAVYHYYTWSITPGLGVVNSSSRNGTTYTASITWTGTGTATIGFSAYGQAPMATKSVTVNCPTATTPAVTFSYSGNSCGSQVISYTATPPAGISWYWQTSSSGTSVTNSSNTFTITSSGTYYLRAKPSCSSTWSGSQATSYRTINPVPGQPSVSNSNYCAPLSLNLSACCPGTNEVIRWYDVPSGGSPISTFQTVNATKTFYATNYNTVTTCESTRAAMTISINSPPGTAVPNASPATVCGTGTTELSATGAGTNEVYRWYETASGGSAISTTQSVSATKSFYVSLYNTVTGCEGTRTSVIVTVNPLPINGSISANTSVICLGQSVTISSSGGVGTPYYWASTDGGQSWNIFNGQYGGQSSFSFTPAQAGTFRFYLWNQTSCGFCWDVNNCTTSPYVEVSVYSLPTASVSNQTICSGQSTAIAIGGTGTSYSWTVSSSNVSGASAGSGNNINQTLTNNSSANGTATYTITPTANGCTGNPVVVTVTVKPIPNAAASAQTICTGSSTAITIANPNAVSGTTYSWTASASNVTGAANGSGNSITQTLSSTTGGTVTYTITPSANGCTGSPITAVVTVTSIATPSVTGHSRFGAGTLTLTGTGAPGGGNYKWYNSSNAYQSTGLTFTTGTVSASTTNYMYVRAINAAGCESASVGINVNIYANPTISAPQTTVVKETPVTLTATAGFDTYTWRNPSNAIVGSNQTYNATLPGTYTVTVTKTGATSNAIPFTLNGALHGLNMNYVVTNQVLVPNITDGASVMHLAAEKVTQSITYFDGLGRPMQSVVTQGSPLKGDMVTPVKYDGFGRQVRDYLPYVTTTNNDGRYKENDLTTQASFYNPATAFLNKIKTDAAPWAEKVFEASPLNRVVQQGAPGSVYQPNATTPANAKSVKLEYLTNTDGTSTNQEKVKIWTLTPVTISGKTEYLLSSTFSYPSNSLYVNVTKDEMNRQVREYKDKQGKVVLKKVQESTTANIHIDSEWTLTYYIYDEFDRLRFVLQPKFIQRNSVYDGLGTNDLKKGMLDSLTFEYRYDGRGRMIYKRVPGAKQVEMVYDNWDRLVLSQDGNQRATTKWSFTKYDVLNRPVITGEITNANTRDQMVTAVNAITNRNENTASGNSVGYTLNLTYPTTATINDIYTITYYDDYSFKTNLSLGTAYDALIPPGFTGVVHNRVKNLVTGTKVRVLQSSPVQWLISASYYDDKYRLLQVVGDDHLNNKNRTTNEYYGLTSWVTKTQLSHGSALTVLTETTYDHMGRVKEMWQTMDGQTANRTLVASHQYNELGQLVEKNVHSTNSGTSFLQSNDYRYNIRGWLTHINNSQLANDGTINDDANDLFGMELKYNEIVSINGVNTVEQFNGNISAIQWKTSNLVDASVEKIYGFTYDNLNRLKDAKYAAKNGASWTADVNLFDENLTYDKNGNITTLKRKSLFNSTTNALIDDLVYKYKGNQLDAVLDNATATYKPYGFTETTTLTTGEYTYDANGSMEVDQNKGIVGPTVPDPKGVLYNHLNLPREVRLGSKKIVYTYNASGTKIRKIAYNDSGAEISRTDYVGGLQYESNVLKFMSTAEGRVVKDGSNWNYEYFHKDHLGNTRVVYGHQKQVDVYKATMETPTPIANKEQSQFYNISTRRVTAFNRTPASIEVTAPNQSAETNGNLNKTIGPAKMVQVSAGDRVQLEVFARYATGTGSNNTLITNLASAVTGSFALTAGESAHTALTNNVPPQAATIGQTTGVPKAYLFYILFNSSYVYQQFGYVAVNSTALAGHQQMYLDITVPTGGYLYTYVANEANVSTATSVYFDDFTIVHTRNTPTLQVLQTNDYYPFGLQIAAQSYQKQTALDNDYLYNGKELQDEHNLGWMDYGARMYMADIGRWGVVDPLSENYLPASPYNYVLNNPASLLDPDGRSAESTIDDKNKTITVKMHYVFYGGGATEKNKDAAIKNINDMFNANAGKDGWSDAGDGWKIKVEVTGEVTDEAGAEELASDSEGNSLYNFVRVEDETYVADDKGEPGSRMFGYDPEGSNSGMWASHDMTDTTPSHETGHGLGINYNSHRDNGIMKAGTNNRKVTSEDLSDIRRGVLRDGRPRTGIIEAVKSLFTGTRTVDYGPTNTQIYNSYGEPRDVKK